jgi:quercetin dioxygenase-like cupin family protein
MKLILGIITASLALAALSQVGIAAEETPVTITELFKRDHPELADKVILVKRIELKPGASAPPHVHPGMVTGYVETGTLEFQLKGEALKNLKAGDTFFEPPGSHHMVARNPDASGKKVVIAFVVNPKDAPLSTPLHQR